MPLERRPRTGSQFSVLEQINWERLASSLLHKATSLLACHSFKACRRQFIGESLRGE